MHKTVSLHMSFLPCTIMVATGLWVQPALHSLLCLAVLLWTFVS